MAIKKQEFYEGAALYQLARGGRICNIRFEQPLIVINNEIQLHLKYSTRARGPWGFTFTNEEQELLKQTAMTDRTVIGLICGSDGVATLEYNAFQEIAFPTTASFRIACNRSYGEYYEVKGPDGRLARKVSPSSWLKILDK